jgi:pre-mRNA-splicing factor ATP-dependent RNA helicase DHX38/PRP16
LLLPSFSFAVEGISAHQEKKVDRPRGLDDFKRRSNRDRDRVRGHPRGWEVTPRSERGPSRDDAPSLRVPNVRWDATPRSQSDGSGGGWGRTGARAWDAPTPRASQTSSPDQGNAELDIREWEEEQVRLDRDWYMGAEEGSLMGDEEHNPLAKYDDLTIIKPVEVAKRPVSLLFIALVRA